MSQKKSDFPAAIIAGKLVSWFAANQREMPWRKTRDPYRIWLSEIMLQQTQVATVIPYYERFVARFPTVHDLAAAPLDEVLKLWAGLGYYSRARNLHRGAQTISVRFGGVMPNSPEIIREIPGIGPYTAGAVLSIAYGNPVPLVDGNVARVFSRMKLIRGDWRQNPAKQSLWDTAGELVAVVSPPLEGGGRGRGKSSLYAGDLNQSLMELGATICTPRSPLCERCPVSAHCLAFQHRKQEHYPEIVKKEAVPVWKLRAWIVRNAGGKILFAQREPDGLFGGLWEVPTEREVASRCVVLGRVKHVLSHRELRISVCEGTSISSQPEKFQCWSGKYTAYRWVTPDAALAGEDIALSSVQKKVLQAALKKITSLPRCKRQPVRPPALQSAR